MKNTWIILCLFLFSCASNNAPENKVEFNKMKVVLWQLMQADEYYARASVMDTSLKTTKKNVQYYKQIFEYNKVDRKAFYTTLAYYEKRPIAFKVLMDSAYALSKREKMNLIVH